MFYFLTSHRISELRRPIAAKFCTVISICVNFLMQVQKLGGPPLKFFISAKFWVHFTQLPTLIADISGTSQDIKNRQDMWSRAIPPAFSETSPVNLGPLSTKYYMWVWTHPSRLFRQTIFRPLRGAGTWNFYTIYRLTRLASAYHKPNRGFPQKFYGRTFKIGLKIQRVNAYNFVGGGHNLTKLYQVCGSWRWW